MGIAIRYAFALGLHLRNEDKSVTASSKEKLVHIWWGLQTFEGSLSIMLGRPSLILDDHCSTPLPLPVSMDQLSEETLSSYWQDAKRGFHIYDDAFAPDPWPAGPSNAGSLLRCLANLWKIEQRSMTALYSTKVVVKSWKDIQETISSLGRDLEVWEASLPSDLRPAQPDSTASYQRERVIVHMSYIRVKILVTRPCLCRVDNRVPGQTEVSKNFDRRMARVCVLAAQELTDVLPEQATAAFLYQIGPWWSMVHHLMQATTVLLLELSYGSIHFSEQKEEILSKVKVLVRSLRTLGKKDEVAGRAHGVAFGAFQDLASRLEIDISDMLQGDADSQETSTSRHRPTTGDDDQVPQSLFEELTHGSGTSHQPMFTFPLNVFKGEVRTSEFDGTPSKMFRMSEESFGNTFGTAHDEQYPSFAERMT